MRIPRKRLFWAVGFGHMLNDIFMSMVPIVLTFLASAGLGISNTQYGFALSLRDFSGAVSQPFFGLRADRDGGRWSGAGGVAWTVGMFTLALIVVAITHNFWLMVIPFVLSALGSGAFHPSGTMHAANSDESRVATNVSWFFLMGQLGLAMGPFLAGSLLQVVSDSSLDGIFETGITPAGLLLVNRVSSVVIVLLIVPFVLPVVYFMASSIPSMSAHHTIYPPKSKSEGGINLRAMNLPIKGILLLLLVVSLRSLATPGSVSFIPRLFEEKEWSPSEYGSITSIFWVASGLAGVYFGGLADRFDRRLVLMGSLIAAAPAFFLLPAADGTLAYGLAIMAGGLSGGSHSVIVVLAQEILPSGKGFATGAILGSIFGMGALGTLLIGTIADTIGLSGAFQLVAITVSVAGVLALLLPTNRPKVVPLIIS